MFKPPTREMLLMPKLGSLEVYTEVPEGTNGIGPISEFYWRDKRHPYGRGPFISLWACVEDFKTIVLQNKENLPAALRSVPMRSTVINLDFKSKKRL